MSLLQIENLDVDIHDTPILRDISIAVEAGQIVGVIGESGSGKSMTAFAVMQLLPEGAFCKGRVKLNGRDVLKLDENALCAMRGSSVAMVFQEPMSALNPIQCIGDQVAETILIHEKVGRGEAMKRAAIALERAELPQDKFPLSRYPFEMSGGQRQRVVIAMAIALRPKLLIADEPTTALDVTTQAQVLALLKRLVQEDGMGMLLITHDLAVVADMADEIVIMKKGEVVEQGPAESLFRTMKHPYTKALFAASGHSPERHQKESVDVILDVQEVVRNYRLPRVGLFGKPRQFRAVDKVSFTLHRGENLGLVGESGCGKSTLTRAILGLDPLQGGTIRLFGETVGPGMSKTLRSRVQVVFQDPYGSFNPRWKVARLVAEPLHLMENPPHNIPEMVADVLRDVGLHADDREKYIHEFSGGQRQRIAIARALILRPDLIVLDEAVSALDVSVRAQVLDLLADLSKRLNLSYLFISHDLSVVRAITDRVLVMRDGKIVEQGLTEDVFSNPAHDYTKELIDAAPKLPETSVI